MSSDFSMEAMQRCIRSISLSTDTLQRYIGSVELFMEAMQPCTMVVAQ
jgi:hypothetical protein